MIYNKRMKKDYIIESADHNPVKIGDNITLSTEVNHRKATRRSKYVTHAELKAALAPINETLSKITDNLGIITKHLGI